VRKAMLLASRHKRNATGCSEDSTKCMFSGMVRYSYCSNNGHRRIALGAARSYDEGIVRGTCTSHSVGIVAVTARTFSTYAYTTKSMKNHFCHDW
jgi:hypothetical protein